MDCIDQELSRTNIFRLDILIPLLEIFDVYALLKHELSPDEFCIYLFVKHEEEQTDDRCKLEFNPVKQYFDNRKELQTLPSLLQHIIIDLLMNIARYATFLESISKDYLDKQQNCRQNYEQQLHQTMVFMYILSYRTFTLFFEDSISCFVHFKVKRMLSLITYLLRTETSDLYREKGCAIYEEDFVDHNLVLPFLDSTPCLEKLREDLKNYMKDMEPRKKELTTPMYMNVLNRPRPLTKTPPNTPEDLSGTRFTRPIPRSNYVRPSTEMKLESLRATNKTNAINLLIDANVNAPNCFQQRRKDLVKTEEEEEPKRSFARKPVPSFKPVEVKYTAASILRECARVVGDEEKEIKKLKALAEGSLDPSSIQKFEEEKRQQQREKELLKIQEKHLLGLLTREGAFIAKQSLLNDVKAHAENVRKEKQELYEKLEKWREKHDKEMMEIVEKCREIEQASRKAFNHMMDEKRQKAAQVSEESRQLRAQLIKQREEETRRKIRLIQEIKTIQSLRALSGIKDFDPTESSGLGLLCEMSLAELKERLFWTKMKSDEKIKCRKSVIHRERERQKNLIRDTQKALEDYKASKRVTAAAESVKSQKHAQPAAAGSSSELDVLRKKLEQRRAQRAQKQVSIKYAK